MRILYIEPIFGLSGDMLIAALIDLGFDKKLLEDAIRKLLKVNIKIKLNQKTDAGFSGKHVKIIFKEEGRRDYSQIKKLINNSELSPYVKKNALKAFEYLASVESKIHHVSKKNVHFHELSGIDTVTDIVGYFMALESLNIDEVYVSSIPIGKGYISCEHGLMPNPAFATLELLKGYNVYGTDIYVENITPTAAVLLKTSAKPSLVPNFVVEKSGYGMGNLNFNPYPNMVRITMGLSGSEYGSDSVFLVEFNVDDASGELMGYLIEKLLKEGALDVYFTPIFMKKNRPAFNVTVMVSSFNFKKILDIIFAETTTLGVRYSRTDRFILKREIKAFNTSLGSLRVKKTVIKGKIRFKPEYDDLIKIARNRKMPLQEVINKTNHEISQKIEDENKV